MAAESQIYVGITIGAAFAGLKAFSMTQTALTSGIFEALGSRATTRELGFDRFWRNARTQTLHDPIDYKL
ncbi:MAG: hypothetical protein LBF86_09605, partial [Helicobacteraceae bacterium]|nr:hypothetical protein [Helicobacteraceae bacterium]